MSSLPVVNDICEDKNRKVSPSKQMKNQKLDHLMIQIINRDREILA